MLKYNKIQFPNPNTANEYGIVASGGALSPDFLLSAYLQGIFPWFNQGEPILWWSPDPRMVLFPSSFKISKSFRQLIRNKKYEIRVDENFREVITQCSAIERNEQVGTWITSEMLEAYVKLHELGFAHCFETWIDDKLVGGLYGISLGRAFFGESMFHKQANASKLALHALVEFSLLNKFQLIDVQQSTNHLKSLGAVDVSRDVFLKDLDSAIQYDTILGKWKM